MGLCFGLVLLFKNLDYIYYDILDPMLNPNVTDINANMPSRWGYFILNILIFVAFALAFLQTDHKGDKAGERTPSARAEFAVCNYCT